MNANPRVTQRLSRYDPATHPQGPIESLATNGGLSGAQLWRFPSDIGPLCLRAWPSNSQGRAHLEQIHRWLSKARSLDFIPVPIPDQHGQTLQFADGTFWELTPWMPGVAVLKNLPSHPQVASAFTALARFHTILADERAFAPSPGLRTRLETARSLEQGGLEKLATAIESASSSDLETREAARHWLSLARPAIPRLITRLSESAAHSRSLQPCLRDARPDHFLFTADHLTGLVDFGSMDIECITADLARLMADWLPTANDLRQTALAAYSRVRPIDAAELEVLPHFEFSADLLIGERWVRWHYIEHRAFPSPVDVVQGIRRSIHRLERHPPPLFSRNY